MKDVLRALRQAKIILVSTHRLPDGDAVGAVLAMAHYLESLGKEYYCYTTHEPGPYLKFLPKIEKLSQDLDLWNKKFDLLVLLDAGDLKITGHEEAIKNLQHEHKIINVDHHHTNTKYGHHNLVNSDAAATCEIIYDLLESVDAITPEIATCLLTGIISDTGCFTNLATTHRAMHKAGKLLNQGANFKKITLNTLYHRPVGTLKLWGKALSRLEEKEGVVSTYISKTDLKECSVGGDALEGVSNFLNILDPDNNRAIMVFSERDGDEIKVGLRSSNRLVDVAGFAKLNGGGGHKKAAGFSFKGTLTKEVVEEKRNRLIEYLRKHVILQELP